ncbi:unnamed protein product [Symbiodinium sp. CCMP2456]|nr:unnamed protein product [Symbiodinium sp. CCMP2456]
MQHAPSRARAFAGAVRAMQAQRERWTSRPRTRQTRAPGRAGLRTGRRGATRRRPRGLRSRRFLRERLHLPKLRIQ